MMATQCLRRVWLILVLMSSVLFTGFKSKQVFFCEFFIFSFIKDSPVYIRLISTFKHLKERYYKQKINFDPKSILLESKGNSNMRELKFLTLISLITKVKIYIRRHQLCLLSFSKQHQLFFLSLIFVNILFNIPMYLNFF